MFDFMQIYWFLCFLMQKYERFDILGKYTQVKLIKCFEKTDGKFTEEKECIRKLVI